ncbi:hypothetical protein WEI85_35805 [Actinomycetes bacterium KLBMP 9797]
MTAMSSSSSVLTHGIRRVLQAFEEDIGRAPRLGELLEILPWGVRTLPGEALVDAHPDEIVGFVPRPGARARDTSVVGELNDSPFVLAADAFNDWWQAGSGKPITVADLAEAVLEALRQIGTIVQDPTQLARLTAVTPTLRRAKARARVGDIISVPAGRLDQHLVVILCRNRFGTAFGLIRGRYPLRRPATELDAAATGIAVYCDEHAITSRRWRIVGHDDRLLGRFPTDPEIYHRPQPPFPGMPPVGEFGSAETASGPLRDLTAAEAHAIDLDGSYQQVYLHDQFEEVIAALIARRSP